jgi:catalase
MARSKKGPRASSGADRGAGGEPHQRSATPLTTNQGVPVADDQNTLRAGVRGPSLLEDFHFLEKMTHFDHERIPERIVHARGSAAHGTFVAYASAKKYTRAAFLQAGVETPVFCRFSTVAGGAGSVDTPRDVRGFAVKFYTQEGVFDLVGNNIPVFFIQDAMKFPDFVHAVKMEPDRGFPQNASAHDTFWDFISLAPEALHMVMWAMSDRAIPRSLRMMEGFGVHTFRLVDADGRATFIKWHWRPTLGMQSTTWDEAVKLAGADQDFHRRDLWEAITSGAFPAWELCVQPIPAGDVDGLPYDILDPTKLVPEEDYPLIPVGKMTLDRWPDNFFAETEQVAFHPGHLVPGVELTSDPLLQGRIFSYTDTQLKRLGGPNFHELPINRPKCPMQNFQRDGMARIAVDRGRTSYEPNSLEPDGPRETPTGFASVPEPVEGTKIRQRSETFADHHSQARLFYRSQTSVEQRHIRSAIVFELSKVESEAVRRRVLGHLDVIDPALGAAVAAGLGMEGMAEAITPARPPIDMPPSPALGILGKAAPTFAGRKLGILVGDGADARLVDRLRAAAEKAGATAQVVAVKLRGEIAADHIVAGGPSVIFDAVAIVTGADGAAALAAMPPAVQWVADAFTHCKVIGVVAAAAPLLAKANVVADDGVIALDGKGVEALIAKASAGRIWAREEAHAPTAKAPARKPSTSRAPAAPPRRGTKPA